MKFFGVLVVKYETNRLPIPPPFPLLFLLDCPALRRALQDITSVQVRGKGDIPILSMRRPGDCLPNPRPEIGSNGKSSGVVESTYVGKWVRE